MLQKVAYDLLFRVTPGRLRCVRADLKGAAGDQAVPAAAVAPAEQTLEQASAPAPGTLARRDTCRRP